MNTIKGLEKNYNWMNQQIISSPSRGCVAGVLIDFL
jgi:hypothetical protein